MARSRRTVTIVFCDIVGSTALGERLDPEAVRHVVQRYFDEARAALERHGGSVEKFIGDAVMAVFGVPQLHEDDALRAVRAADELSRRVAALNEELARDRGATIAVRIGVNTGEVITGDGPVGQHFATGDTVNVAARLEQAAGPGEILIGNATRRLLPDAVRVDGPDLLELKGKTEPVPAWRLIEVPAETPAFMRRIDAPFVGRKRELSELAEAFESAAGGTCRLVTVLAPPGLGKSRLARELAAEVHARARVVVGRCIPYGEDITYWPLREIVGQVAGHDEAGLARAAGSDESAQLVVERIAGAIGRGPAAGRPEEIAWAVRRLFETLASEQPLVAILDDIHWAAPAFLDLIEYVAGFASGAILLLALARPDLLDVRGSWAAPRPGASVLALEPLSEQETGRLAGGLPGGSALTAAERDRIVVAAEGNPLFVEQMLAYRADEPGDGMPLPPTIHALLATRIDRLEPGERAVVERGAIEGRSFHRGAVAELLPEDARGSLAGDLMALVRKELIRPDESSFAGDDGFRFAHGLVRDAAYASVAKEVRADLHERFAAWLERAGADRLAEYEEILAHHLEEACRYRAELGPAGEREHALARAAAEHLVRASERADARGDLPAQVSLLSRAAAVLPPTEPRLPEIRAELGYALTETRGYPRAEEVLLLAIEGAHGSDARAEARARVALSYLRYAIQPREIAEHRAVAEEAIHVLGGLEDGLGLARAWDLVAWLDFGQGQCAAAEAAWERSIAHARHAGSARHELAGLSSLASVAVWGPTPRADALRRCEDILATVHGHLAARAVVLGLLGCLRALEGRFDEARGLVGRRDALFEEIGLQHESARHAHADAWIEMLAGDPVAAERILRRGYQVLEGLGGRTQLQVVGSYLARALGQQGRWEEAERLAVDVEELDPTGIAEIASARCTRGKAAASLGRVDEGIGLARAGLEMIDSTDFLLDRADARVDLGEVLRLAGRDDDADALLDEARRLHEQKGNSVSAARAAAQLVGR
jgi:class 3 adenylate cyclase/tetratricopeptide (TPR) repeat protein